MSKRKHQPKPTPPQTEAEWCAYRVALNCKVGRDIITGAGQPPQGVTRAEYALYMALHAIEELAKQVTQNQTKPITRKTNK